MCAVSFDLIVCLFQETVAETLRPLAEGTDNHGGSLTSAAGVLSQYVIDFRII